MKRFACGDVIPGCNKTFEGATTDDVVAAVAVHAHDDHGIEEVDADTVTAVLGHMQDV